MKFNLKPAATAPTRNWRFSGKMKLCAGYQVQ